MRVDIEGSLENTIKCIKKICLPGSSVGPRFLSRTLYYALYLSLWMRNYLLINAEVTKSNKRERASILNEWGLELRMLP